VIWSGLLLAVVPAAAGEPSATDPVSAEASAQTGTDAVSGVNALFAEGKTRFDQQDYDGALSLWNRAYEQAPANPAGRAFRVGMAPHLALAHEYRYRQAGAQQDLQRTKSLLLWHVDHYKALYKPSAEAREHITKMKSWLAEVDLELARVTAPARAAPPQATVAPPPRPRPVRKPRPSSRQVRDALYADPELHGRYSSGRGMVAGGVVMAVSGGVVAVVALGAQVNNEPPFISLAGLALAAGGVALIVVGGKRKRTATREARRRLSLLPTGKGLVLSGRF
jgi:hypothetical protein